MDKKSCTENNRQQSLEHTQNEISSLRSFGQNVFETPTGDIVQNLSFPPYKKQQGGSGRTRSKSSEADHPEAGLKTSDFYKVRDNVPERFNHPDCFKGYGKEIRSPCYQTSADVYGSRPPSVHTMPTQFHGLSQKFTMNLGKFGMYRNHSLNTSKD